MGRRLGGFREGEEDAEADLLRGNGVGEAEQRSGDDVRGVAADEQGGELGLAGYLVEGEQDFEYQVGEGDQMRILVNIIYILNLI